MKRRSTLRLAASGLAGLAGCVSVGYDPPASGNAATTDTATTDTADPTTPTTTRSPTTDATEPPAGTATPTSTPTADGPRIVERSFRVTGRECGDGEESAHSTLDAPRVVIEGTAVGSNGCETARLDAATYDPDTDTLTAVVEVYRPTGANACTQCLTDIDYRLRVRFEGGMPGRVRVVHGNAVVEESTVG